MIFMTAKELVEYLALVDPETEVIVGKIEKDKFKTAFVPDRCAVLAKGDDQYFCIFYNKTLNKEKSKGELN